MPKIEFRLPDIKSVAKVLGIYGAGVVTAGFFLSGPGEYAGSLNAPERQPAAYAQQQRSDPPPQQTAAANAPAAIAPSSAAPSSAVPSSAVPMAETRTPDPDRQVRTIPIVRPQPETSGFSGERREATRAVASDADADDNAAPAGCNVSACRAHYRSFDTRTCTYRSYSGDTRRCTR